jgi:nucleoside-diphosphate-sugar epimerase
MNILITGSNGFLATVLKTYLSEKDEIKTLSRRAADYNIDLSLEIPIFSNNLDLVIHAAGKAHSIPSSDFEKNQFYLINVIGVQNLLKGLENSKPKKFIFISSVSVYGLFQGENIDESTPLLAKDPYGNSKIEAENIVKEWCEKHDVICTILRLPLVVGENPPGNLGAMIRGIKKGYYFNIAGGNAQKSMVLAMDVAKFILAAAEIGGTYNLTDGYHPTFKELSTSIGKVFEKTFIPNLPKFSAQILSKLGDLLGNKFPINSDKFIKITSTLTFDDTKARIAFGWNPSPVLDSFKIHYNAN